MAAEVDPIYSGISEYLIDTAQNNAMSMNTTATRRWFNFSAITEDPNLPIFDREYPCKTFKRERLNKDYINIQTAAPEDGGRGKVATAMSQLHLMAGWERDISARFKSRIRAVAHHASNTNAQGSQFGSIATAYKRSMKMIVNNNAEDTQ